MEGDDGEKKRITLTLPVLPCYDETDDGIPPCCRGDDPTWWKLFNPKNPITNDNLVCIMFGNVGFKYFDHRRRDYMVHDVLVFFLLSSFEIERRGSPCGVR